MSPRPLLLGHRGARAVRTIRENTVASFDRALSDGCDGFEFDVRLTAHGEAVICHDPSAAGICIAETSVDQLPQLAQLGDVLCRYQDSAFLDIELKVSGLEKIIAKLIRKFPPRRGFVVSSFLPEVLTAVQAQDCSIPVGLICENKSELRRWRKLPMEYVIPRHDLVSRILAEDIKAAGKKMLAWTVNSAEEMRRFRDLGVDGIISDKTSLLCRTLKDEK